MKHDCDITTLHIVSGWERFNLVCQSQSGVHLDIGEPDQFRPKTGEQLQCSPTPPLTFSTPHTAVGENPEERNDGVNPNSNEETAYRPVERVAILVGRLYQ